MTMTYITYNVYKPRINSMGFSIIQSSMNRKEANIYRMYLFDTITFLCTVSRTRKIRGDTVIRYI